VSSSVQIFQVSIIAPRVKAAKQAGSHDRTVPQSWPLLSLVDMTVKLAAGQAEELRQRGDQ
jgi:hypothetical protein